MSVGVHHLNGNGSVTCVDCELPVFTRNHYFTGKLMVERDFTDEQRYFLGKDRRHDQRLHGWGTVCGLKVVQHENEACRKQWVVVEPGTAVDCCGREIVVREPEYFDFRSAFLAQWQATNGPDSQPDADPHRLQISLCYAECATEDVPVLFDDCGCDDTACLPNRINESFTFGVRIDGDRAVNDPLATALRWGCTMNVQRAAHVRLHDDRLYVIGSADGAAPWTLHVFETEHSSLLAQSMQFTDVVHDLALSPDGKTAYVAVSDAGAAPNGLIKVVDLTADPLAELPALTVPNADTDRVRLAVSADGRIYALATATGIVHLYDPGSGPAPSTSFLAVANAIDIAVSSDGNTVYVADTTDTAKQLDTANPGTAAADTFQLPSGSATLVDCFSTTAGDNLAIAYTDGGANGVHLVGLRPGPGGSSTTDLNAATITNKAVALQASPGGVNLFMLEEDAAGAGSVEVVRAHRVELGQPDTVTAAVAVGDQPADMALSDDGKVLYVAFSGPAGTPTSGGVALLKVMDSPCDKIWERALEACPECNGDHCLILATVEDYTYDVTVVDDSVIDNLTDRKLLPSTELITEVVNCLLQGGGGGGTGS
ncbi:MAG TPA: hypothetical protein VHS03_03535, partial [Gaiellaceae bacterium]|nr:hypothetical protein [Gaiellaceae bacterium]